MIRGACVWLVGSLGMGFLWARDCEPSLFQLNQAPLYDVVRSVSDLTGGAMALDSAIAKVKVSFVVDRPTSCEAVLLLFEQLLAERGWMMRSTARGLKVMGAPDTASSPRRRMYSVPAGLALQVAEKARSSISASAVLQVPDTHRVLVVAHENDHLIFRTILDEFSHPLALTQSTHLQVIPK
jgi:type II secretory pathway component GspD/PulD (secretin)